MNDQRNLSVMKIVLFISFILFVPVLSWSQRPLQPAVPPQRPVQPAAPSQPPTPANGTIPDNIILPRAPGTNTSNTNSTDTNQLATTNVIPAELTNSTPPVTNEISPAMVHALALTNRLAVMAPAQVQAVILVQVGLDDLQRAAASIQGASGIRQAIHDHPELEQQLKTVAARIFNLARGSDRPSNDSVDRLAEDLLRAGSQTSLDKGSQLVLSVVVNLVVNCQHLPPAQLGSAVNDAEIVLRNSGLSPALCNTVGCDLNSMALEIRPDLGI